MVKHGRDKKRRAGRIGKTKLKNRTWSRFNPNPKVDPALKHLWDPSQTPTANLTNLGLVAHPNKKVSGGAGCTHTSDGANETSNSSVTDNSTIIELFDVPESDGFTRNNLRTKFPLDVEEEKYVVKCMGKYGDNYTSMFRDIKINNMQHTEEKLRKLCTRYILLTNEQRRVDIPENVQNIIDKLQ